VITDSRHPPAARQPITEVSHVRQSRRFSAALSAHPRSVPLCRPVHPYAGKHRIYGTGPRYSKLGGRVVYRLEDLQSWVESGAKASTSDPGASAVLPAKRHPAAAQPPAVQTRR
jgi:hypothetical protein